MQRRAASAGFCLETRLLVVVAAAICAANCNDVNIALNKPAQQISTYQGKNASLAVNGKLDNFSNTNGGTTPNQWWMVDLEEEFFIKYVKIYKRTDSCCQNRLRMIYILTSVEDSPTDPHPRHADWTIRYYLRDPLAEEQTITLYLPTPSRRLAVFSQNSQTVELREVEVFSYNVADSRINDALSSTSIQVSTQFEPPSRALDGNNNMFNDDSYFSSFTIGNHWLRVQLTCSSCRVKIYPYLRGNHGIGNNEFSRLSKFSILTSDKTNPGIPGDDNSYWTSCFNQEADQRGPLEVMCGNGSPAAIYVAVYKNAIEALEIAELEIFSPEPEFSSSASVSVLSRSTTCVDVNWTAASHKSSYRYECNEVRATTTDVTVSLCGQNSDTQIHCTVEALGDGGVSSQIQGSGRTKCTAPTFGLNDSIYNGKRMITVSNIQWSNCAGVNQLLIDLYRGGVAIVSRSASNLTSGAETRTFPNLTAITNYTITAHLISTGGRMSDVTSRAWTTGELAPIFGGDAVTLTAASSATMILSWSPPRRPNGVITKYEYRCKVEPSSYRDNWQQRNPNQASARPGGFSPYDAVSCEVKVFNSAGDDTVSVGPVHTSCAAPTSPRGINATQMTTGSEAETKIRLSFTWQGSEPNCAGVKYAARLINIDHGDVTNHTGIDAPQLAVDVKPHSQHTLYLMAVNNGGQRAFSSETTEFTLMSREAPPFYGNAAVSLTAVSTSSLNLAWSPPQYPYGVITNYQYRCSTRAGSGSWMDRSTTQVFTVNVEGYEPYEAVFCRVRAINSAGMNGKDTSETRTFCSTPTNPSNIAVRQEGAGSGSAKRVDLTITWQASLPRCHNLSYEVSLINSRTNYRLINNRSKANREITQQVRPGENFTVSITAINNHGNRSEPVVYPFSCVESVPFYGNATVSLTAVSSSSLNLTWSPPQYPYGVITQYQYRCSTNSVTGPWTDTSIAQVFSLIVRGYEPYQAVVCRVRAINSAGMAGKDTAETTTFCSTPTNPSNIEVGQVSTGSGSTKWINLTITWQASLPRCHIVSYEVSLKNSRTGNRLINNRPNTNRRITQQVYPGENFTLSVTAVNNHENRSESVVHPFSSFESAPFYGNAAVSLTAVSSSSLSLTWSPPQYPYGVITKYQYRCSTNAVLGSWMDRSTTQAFSVIVGDYEPYEAVFCRVRAINSAGINGKVTNETRTFCAQPTGVKFSITQLKSQVEGKKKRRALAIDIQNTIDPNCEEIEHLRVSIDNGSYSETLNTTVATNPVRFTNLPAVTSYSVTVVAVNNHGNESEPVSNMTTTGELAPYTPPSKFSMATNSSCVFLTWEAPAEPNGNITQYQVECEYSPTSNDTTIIQASTQGTTQEHTNCSFPSATKVICSICASTSEGESPSANQSKFTLYKVREAPSPPSVRESETYDIQIPISFPPIQFKNEDVTVKFYQIIVERVSQSANSRSKRSDVGSDLDGERLFNFTSAETYNLTYYVAARLNLSSEETMVRFIVGDGKVYDGFLNRRLERAKQYKIHYSFTVELDGHLLTDVQSFSRVYDVAALEPVPLTQNILAAIGVVVVIPIVVVAVIIWRKRFNKASQSHRRGERRKIDKDESTNGKMPAAEIGLSDIRGETSNTLRNAAGSGSEDPQNIYMNVELAEVLELDESVLEDFVDHHEETMKMQYKKLESVPCGEATAACQPENKGKNRFKGLYPADAFRVLLQDNVGGTDFINASYMPGVRGNNKYIASMAPNDYTLNDFWLMVWQQRVSTIVMVTNLVEEGRKKCEQYWPDLTVNPPPKVFKHIKVTILSEVQWVDYIIRTFRVNKNGESRSVTQYHYLGWPDHGVPDSAPFVQFYMKVSAGYRQHKTGPLLVHCSAGVGRTGTFIALDRLLEEGSKNKQMNIYRFISDMRERRPSMIQREEQYIFLHQALLEYTVASSFVTDSEKMQEKLCSYQANPESGTSILQKEFRMIEKRVKNKKHNFQGGKESVNRSKNRYLEILPSDSYRPFLLNGDSAYINAVLVNSCRGKNYYAVTQLPMGETITDFWTLINETKSLTILLLQSPDVPFFPSQEGGQTFFGPHTITTGSVHGEGDIVITELSVSTADKPMRKMKVIELGGWDTNSMVYPDAESIITFYSHVKQWQQKSGSQPVTVVCMNGATRSGLYINISNSLETLEMEQQVDVYNTVLMSRLRRPQFINTMEQYEFIYQVLNQYCQAFAEYSNFQ